MGDLEKNPGKVGEHVGGEPNCDQLVTSGGVHFGCIPRNEGHMCLESRMYTATRGLQGTRHLGGKQVDCGDVEKPVGTQHCRQHVSTSLSRQIKSALGCDPVIA